MPPIALTPQQDGFWRGWTSYTGADFAYQCVDDSSDTTHDEGATSLRLGLLILGSGLGRVSFPFFIMAEHLIPRSVTVNVAAQKVSGNLDLQCGFARNTTVAFDAVTFSPGVDYSVQTWTFSTNPFTGMAWADGDLTGTEVCVQSKLNQIGMNDISLISASLDYYAASDHAALRPEWMVS